MEVFGKKYSRYYDTVYAGKDYEKECDYLEKIFAEFRKKPIRSILDVACGTGAHAFPMAKRGYDVLGSDISKDMISLAKRKIVSSGIHNKIEFRVNDMRTAQSGREFDACICMFSSVGYLVELSDLKKMFDSVYAQLVGGGLFVFDFWNGLAVLTVGPSARIQSAKKDKVRIIRASMPRHRPLEDTVSVEIRTLVLESAKLVDEFMETHDVRYFFPSEIKYLLESSRLELVSIHKFMNIDEAPSVFDWNITAVARKVA